MADRSFKAVLFAERPVQLLKFIPEFNKAHVKFTLAELPTISLDDKDSTIVILDYPQKGAVVLPSDDELAAIVKYHNPYDIYEIWTYSTHITRKVLKHDRENS